MDIDRIYQLMGSALKRVYGFYVKRPLQRFNVDNRAEKALEVQQTIPKSAPRHEKTDQLFKQIAENNPHFREELTRKREDLVNRLSDIKVVSKERQFSAEELQEMEEIKQRVRNRLPQSRQGTELPLHAYVEPSHVPQGRISLIRAFDFIGKHSKDNERYTPESIARQHHLSEEDVKNVLNYFKPFYREHITDPIEDTEKVLGLHKQQFEAITSFLKPIKDVENKERIESTSADESVANKKSQTNGKIS